MHLLGMLLDKCFRVACEINFIHWSAFFATRVTRETWGEDAELHHALSLSYQKSLLTDANLHLSP
jgi:hypothetical protein